MPRPVIATRPMTQPTTTRSSGANAGLKVGPRGSTTPCCSITKRRTKAAQPDDNTRGVCRSARLGRPEQRLVLLVHRDPVAVGVGHGECPAERAVERLSVDADASGLHLVEERLRVARPPPELDGGRVGRWPGLTWSARRAQTEGPEEVGVNEVRDRGDRVAPKRDHLDREGLPLRSLGLGTVVREARLGVRRNGQEELTAATPPRPFHECADVRPADIPLTPRWHAPGRVLLEQRDEAVDIALLPGLHITHEQAALALVGNGQRVAT